MIVTGIPICKTNGGNFSTRSVVLQGVNRETNPSSFRLTVSSSAADTEEVDMRTVPHHGYNKESNKNSMISYKFHISSDRIQSGGLTPAPTFFLVIILFFVHLIGIGSLYK